MAAYKTVGALRSQYVPSFSGSKLRSQLYADYQHIQCIRGAGVTKW